MKDKLDKITELVGIQFKTFGGGQGSEWNPLAEALKDSRLQFAAGVDVESVVDYIMKAIDAL